MEEGGKRGKGRKERRRGRKKDCAHVLSRPRSGEGLTPLHVAASWGCTACLGLLLTEGGDPHLEDQVGPKASLPRKWRVGLATSASV